MERLYPLHFYFLTLFKLNEKRMNITLIDPQQISDPEILAMLMAFYSRSTKPVHERLETLGESEAQIKQSLKKFYIGYGHDSIADCSSVSVFFEGVSLLAAKYLESSPLFNGQECSTRYIDFSAQGTVDPFNTEYSKQIQNRWLSLYTTLQTPVRQELERLNPKTKFKSEEVWTRAIKAKTLDITRAFLPVGMKTSVALHMGMRSLNDHLHVLTSAPEFEVSELAKTTIRQLKERFPFVFDKKILPEVETFRGNSFQYTHHVVKQTSPKFIQSLRVEDDISGEIYNHVDFLNSRPKFTEIPPYFASLGTITIDFALDYGSWRDLQRHRNTVYNKTTLISNSRIFYSEYLKQIPKDVGYWTLHEVNEQYREIEKLYHTYQDLENLQYYLPLGNIVNAKLILTIPQLVYITELRSSQAVHFTLRQLILSIVNILRPKYPMLFNHVDLSPTEFCFNRGEQTIVKKDTM